LVAERKANLESLKEGLQAAKSRMDRVCSQEKELQEKIKDATAARTASGVVESPEEFAARLSEETALVAALQAAKAEASSGWTLSQEQVSKAEHRGNLLRIRHELEDQLLSEKRSIEKKRHVLAEQELVFEKIKQQELRQPPPRANVTMAERFAAQQDPVEGNQVRGRSRTRTPPAGAHARSAEPTARQRAREARMAEAGSGAAVSFAADDQVRGRSRTRTPPAGARARSAEPTAKQRARERSQERQAAADGRRASTASSASGGRYTELSAAMLSENSGKAPPPGYPVNFFENFQRNLEAVQTSKQALKTLLPSEKHERAKNLAKAVADRARKNQTTHEDSGKEGSGNQRGRSRERTQVKKNSGRSASR